VKAIDATFTRRGTPLPEGVPAALTNEFAGNPAKMRQWSGFVTKSGVSDPGDLSAVVRRVARFVMEPLTRARSGTRWQAKWPKGGPWS
jgi:hypothetical protein